MRLAGAELAFETLVERRAMAMAGVLGAVLLSALAAAAEHRVYPAGASTRALEGPVFGLLVPAAALGIVRLATRGRRIDDALGALARFGPRRPLLLGWLLVVTSVTALSAALMGALGSLVARDAVVSSVWADAATSAWIGALAGAAYAPLFAFGSTYGARGAGSFVVFALDLFLGGTATLVAIPFPKAHALNLLGGAPPALAEQWLSQAASAFSLVVIALVSALATVLRCAP